MVHLQWEGRPLESLPSEIRQIGQEGATMHNISVDKAHSESDLKPNGP